METGKLKSYAPKARLDFIEAVKAKAALYGVTEKDVSAVTAEGDVVIIAGRAFPAAIRTARANLVAEVDRHGFEQAIEHIAYTWFNRFVALRYMELKGFLAHGYRVLSHPDKAYSNATPEILASAERVDIPGLNKEKVIELKLDGTKDDELYRELILAQCQALHSALPFMSDGLASATNLLLPDNLLHTDSVIRKLVSDVPEELWQDVEIIGWLYQFYISEKKDQVIGKVVKSEDIPAATQLFTPNWIVKYLVQNSLGRQWVATYPDSPLKEKMEYYITPAEQTAEVQAKLDDITPKSLDPEEITFLDPACGSGHILVEAYDLFKEIYLERGYRLREVPRIILEKNLFGLEIDDRAAQLSQFSLMIKARDDDSSILDNPPQLNIISIEESNGIDRKHLLTAFSSEEVKELLPADDLFPDTIPQQSLKIAEKAGFAPKAILGLLDTFENAKTFGSLIQVQQELCEKLYEIESALRKAETTADMFQAAQLPVLRRLVEQSRVMGRKYDCVVANPPYMGSKHFNPTLKKFVKETLPIGKTDLYAAFMARVPSYALATTGRIGLITMQSWMFLSTSEDLRNRYLTSYFIDSMAHLGPRAFKEISGEVVQATAFIATVVSPEAATGRYLRLIDYDTEEKREKTLEAIQNPDCGCFFEIEQSKFFDIPGAPIAYWVSEEFLSVFNSSPALGDSAVKGMDTGGSIDVFLRFFWEVSSAKISLFSGTDSKWFPIAKGGKFRRWYGNHWYVVNYENDGAELRKNKANLRNSSCYFRRGLTWTVVSSGGFAVRVLPEGFIFDQGGSAIFKKCESTWSHSGLLGFFNSVIVRCVSELLCPTLNFTTGDLRRFPVPIRSQDKCVDELIQLHKDDWDSVETSWDFQTLELVRSCSRQLPLAQSVASTINQYKLRRERVRELETSNNKFFIDLYEFDNLFKADVLDDDLTLRDLEESRCIEELVSYAVGCMMGRYSLDEPGLIYAHSGNEGFDSNRYTKFPADDDGIIPLTELEWHLCDDAPDRFAEFVSVAWPKQHLDENLDFVADVLGHKGKETSRDSIRRYFSRDFFKNHMQMYKNRPIYWLVSSGKQRAFQALIYLHRYNEGTLARMRQEYVIPLQGKINGRIEQLDSDIEKTSQTPRRKQLSKERDLLKRHQEELRIFDEKLNFYAQKRISIDLDDGVKVNYGKFGDLLAEVKKIHGKAPELEYKQRKVANE